MQCQNVQKFEFKQDQILGYPAIEIPGSRDLVHSQNQKSFIFYGPYLGTIHQKNALKKVIQVIKKFP